MSNQLIGARMPRKDVELLKRVCMARGEDVSDFLRRAVKTELAKLSYLSEDEKKALGVTSEPANKQGDNSLKGPKEESDA